MDLEALRQRWVDWASGKQGETCDEIFGEAMAEVGRLKAENEQLKERLEDVYLEGAWPGKNKEGV